VLNDRRYFESQYGLIDVQRSTMTRSKDRLLVDNH